MDLIGKNAVQKNYQVQSPFSSFLPGIGGLHGIPLWCYYVNRGQAVVSFGTETKDHSIMEFYPAHQSFQMVKNLGFRSFLKVDGIYYEPFRNDEAATTMTIGKNSLELTEVHEELGFSIHVKYYVLPEENLGALVRKVTIKNLKKEKRDLQWLDGMPAILPYGISLRSMKDTGQTMKAWMKVEVEEENLPYYRVKTSTTDTSEVQFNEKGNFYLTVGPEGHLLRILVDPQAVFLHDLSYEQPVNFKRSLKDVLQFQEIPRNQVPSAFSAFEGEVQAEGSVNLTSYSGMAESKEILRSFKEKVLQKGYEAEKENRADQLVEEITSPIRTSTAHDIFDAYCEQTFLDNVLRGGAPVKMGDKVIHVYSRKHGDIERDYNAFMLAPEFYSQGNGNFRDVNQNRRSDVRFYPYVEDRMLKMFYHFIQLDGYNPLQIRPTMYQAMDLHKILALFPAEEKDDYVEFFSKEFSLGRLSRLLEEKGMEDSELKVLFEKVLTHSEEVYHADFLEGYWTDHFVYNLDLLENYLSVYPEKKKSVLFEDRSYTYYVQKAHVLKREDRYVETKRGIRQYKALEEMESIGEEKIRKEYGRGEIYTSTLLEKLVLLASLKFATLDMEGRGIEMEGGKPGWYDALNGLPGLFGSNVADACELLRLLKYLEEVMDLQDATCIFPEEFTGLLESLEEIVISYEKAAGKKSRFEVWDEMNTKKEIYREKIRNGISGAETVLSGQRIKEVIASFRTYLSQGIRDAVAENEGLCPTYYSYEIKDYEKKNGKVVPRSFERKTLPLFLEGPVKHLKLVDGIEEREEIAKRVRTSALYDEKLKMYKVNTSLEHLSGELGRAKSFSPGWLENESIWLHMEYKYLLELLKNGVYERFFEDFKTMCVPFLNSETYGRSLLENSSFIASSANPDPKIHGKGFVARLSGSTAEFLDMYQRMMFGEELFCLKGNLLELNFAPCLPEYLVPEDGKVEATLLGRSKVSYHFSKKKNIIPGEYVIRKMEVLNSLGETDIYFSSITGEEAEKVRKGQVEHIKVYVDVE